MIKKIFFAIVLQGSAVLLVLNPAEGFAQEGVLKIEVTDSISGETLEFASVIVESAGVTACQGVTDMKGALVFKNLASGEYTVKTMYVGYPKDVISGVMVKNHETTYLDISLSTGVKKEFVYRIYKKPLIDPGTVIKKTYDFEEIKMSALDPLSLVGTSGVETKPGVSPSFRGARTTSNVIYVDGQRVIGSPMLPRMGLQQISITLGGVPAMYGDGTGGFIEMETRSGLVNSSR